MNNSMMDMISKPGVWAIIAILLLGLVAAWWWGKRHYNRNRRILRVLNRISPDALHGVVIPDGVGGMVEIDHLLLTPSGLYVIDIKNYRGVLFGADKADAWSQVVGVKTYRFDNPLPHNEARVQAIKVLFPDTPVTGVVVFTNDGEFPKGIPQGVAMLNQLHTQIKPVVSAHDIPGAYLETWQKFKQTYPNQDSSQ